MKSRKKLRNPYPSTPTAQSEHVNLVELLWELVLLELLSYTGIIWFKITVPHWTTVMSSVQKPNS